ncbi:hypothetical protein [Flagellimonas allohymeniacidonis]|uniref:Uncharacterized protein n=1 Tax=Flagellimonas allohymeniacidonis TaxID=2517819 RepID=A0A4Q8QKZ9_9FLAO|nr:hypothetical protein [Allomuricauda hymeniacidonis]TAI48916.1 hypothetical protein EW142_03720 [Allomuricauda hymeniacidonis]
MKNFMLFLFLVALAGPLTTLNAQKGMGESEGIAKTGEIPEMQTISGLVTEIKKGPCTYTVGKSVSGTHLMVQTEDDVVLNIHLGPTAKIFDFIEDAKGHHLEAIVFTTEKLPENHFIAKEVTYNENKLVLRNGYLKPFWAHKKGREYWK